MDDVELLDPIGAGASATVFRARLADGRICAAKRVAAGDVEGRARLRREARTMQRLTHPNVLAPLGTVERDGELLLLLPLAEGSLADRLNAQGPRPPAEVADLGVALAGALAHAHGLGVLHRDVKPHNVLWSQGVAVLADFGAAAVADRATPTIDGQTIGSAPYLDPRVADGAAPDPEADVYSLAATLHEALTGQPPYLAPTPLATIEQARQRSYHRPAVAGASAAELVGVLAGVLAEGDRPDAATFADRLRAAARSLNGPAGTTPVAWAHPRPLRRRSEALTDTRSFPTGAARRSGAAPARPHRLAAAAAITGALATTAAAAASLHVF